MKLSSKAWIGAALLYGAAVSAAPAQPPAGRALPALALAAEDGTPAAAAALHPGSPWVLLVVDAGRPRTQAALARLETPQGWGDGVHVLVLGDDAAFQALQQRYRQLTGVRWVRDADGSALRTLRLPGLPAMLGIDAQGRIAWQNTGFAADANRLQAQLSSWLTGGQP
ncbi:hypothetical protein [Pseudoduganella violaceinigra]|uniref:hypothetical protein n=1 Tax=Pseudoduganella violaceinigra TaxID=246602 RepID=UPI000402EC46|nr:hypothetical protein [Pseudoduganella violaceinigra]